MDDQRFDTLARTVVSRPSRRALARAARGALLGALLAGRGGAEAATCQRKNKPCGGDDGRCCDGLKCCNGTCRDLDRDKRNCGRCGTRCRGGTTCLNGGCFGPGICPPTPKYCDAFGDSTLCSDADTCFCTTTGAGRTVCLQDQPFCTTGLTRCRTNDDCRDGRICVDVSDCCADDPLPAGARTCLRPCPSSPMPMQATAARRAFGQGGMGR